MRTLKLSDPRTIRAIITQWENDKEAGANLGLSQAEWAELRKPDFNSDTRRQPATVSQIRKMVGTWESGGHGKAYVERWRTLRSQFVEIAHDLGRAPDRWPESMRPKQPAIFTRPAWPNPSQTIATSPPPPPPVRTVKTITVKPSSEGYARMLLRIITDGESPAVVRSATDEVVAVFKAAAATGVFGSSVADAPEVK